MPKHPLSRPLKEGAWASPLSYNSADEVHSGLESPITNPIPNLSPRVNQSSKLSHGIHPDLKITSYLLIIVTIKASMLNIQ